MSKLLKGKKALLIAEGCKLNKEKKLVELRLKEIKEELNFSTPGTYRNEAGDELVISETEKWTEIDPKDVLDYLKTQKMGKKFFECVKVQLTPLKKFVPESVINKMRKPLDSITRWSWK